MKIKPLLVVLLAGQAGVASAEDENPDVGDPLTMNSLTPVSTFGIDVGVPIWDTPDNQSFTSVGITLHGHYVDQGSGIGGYINVPLQYLSGEIDLGFFGTIDDNEFSIGNLEIGAMYAKQLRHLAIVGHVGVAVPTHSAEEDLLGGLTFLASAPRYTDLVTRIPESTWLRLGASPMGRQGKLFWRADLGIDIALDDDNQDSASPAYYFNIGGGVDLGQVSLQLEIDTLVTDTDGDDTNSVLAIGARFDGGKFRPGVSMFFPLGWDDTNVDWDFGFGVSLLARL